MFVVLFKIFAEGGVLRKLVEVSAVEDDVIAAGSVLLFLGFEEGRFGGEVQAVGVFGFEASFLDIGILIAAHDGGGTCGEVAFEAFGFINAAVFKVDFAAEGVEVGVSGEAHKAVIAEFCPVESNAGTAFADFAVDGDGAEVVDDGVGRIFINKDAVRLSVGRRVDGDGAGFGVGYRGALTVFDVDAVGVLPFNVDGTFVGDGVLAFAIDAVSVFGVSGDGNGAFVDDGAADVGVDADGITAVITLDGDGCAGVIGNGAGGRAVHAVRRARAEVADGDAPDAPVYAVRRVLYVRSVLYAVYVFALFCADCNVDFPGVG